MCIKTDVKHAMRNIVSEDKGSQATFQAGELGEL